MTVPLQKSASTDEPQTDAAHRNNDASSQSYSSKSYSSQDQGLNELHEIEILARLDVDELNEKLSGASPLDVLELSITKLFTGEIALVSSFGAESAILLHMAGQIDPYVPVIFVDTGKLFSETLSYRDQLIKQFGLQNVHTIKPETQILDEQDPEGSLWQRDVDHCCNIRKVLPFEGALAPYVAEISGRKKFQNEVRADLGFFQKTDKRVKVNPLINWSAAELAKYVKDHDLPRHPLVALGYPSIGCAPCTSPVAQGEDPRAGRWRGEEKTECGIHFVDGKPVRMGAK